jgi:MinD-like ATPase involved in chromosome partitioning or flagellar assembly
VAEVALVRRIVLGLGRPEREGTVLRALEGVADLEVIQTCLSGPDLLALAAAGRADVAAIASDLYQLNDAVVERLGQTRIQLVVLASDPEEVRWRRLKRAIVLPLGAPPEEILAALRGQRPEGTRQTKSAGAPGRVPSAAAQTPEERFEPDGQVLVVTKLFGAPGATVTAINLAAACGEGTLLIELDAGPTAATYVDGDPLRNVYQVAVSAPTTPTAWTDRLDDELQPLYPGTRARLLAGVQHPDQRPALTAEFVDGLLDAARQRFALVIVDVGLAGLLGSEADLVRGVLTAADRVLLVGVTDLVGLWHTRTALELLGEERDRLALVLNRYDTGRHDGVGSIAYRLGEEPLAVIPYDYAAFQAALEDQRPLVYERRGRAAQALRTLANRMFEDPQVTAVPATPPAPDRHLRSAQSAPGLTHRLRRLASVMTGSQL